MNALRTKKKKKNDDDIATLSAVSKVTSKKYLDDTGLGRLVSLIVSFVRNYAAAKTHNHDGVYAKSSHTHTTAQVTGLDSALADKASTSHNHNGVYAPVSHNHDAGAITSGTLPIHKGGTGATSKAAAANSIGVYSLNDKTYISSNADLNTYTTAGTYTMPFDVGAVTLKNCPTGGKSFTLWVDYILSSTMYIVQKVQRYDDGTMYHRESVDSGSHWSSWKVVLDSGNYNSYVPTKTGGGASGTWIINVTGSAGSVPWSGVTGKPSTFSPSSHTHTIADVTNLQSSLDSKQPKGSYAAASHNHGTVTDNFTVNVEDTTTDSGWSMIGGNNGHLLKSIRTQAKAPSWLMDNFGAGIAFGGADTKGVMSVSYFNPIVRFAGGNGTNPNWSFDVSGTTGKAYNLDNMSVNGHSHDASAITSGTLPVSRGGTGHTNLVDSANSMIDSLTVGADTPTDNEYVISQVADGGVAHKKPMSALWSWIKFKCDAIYQPKGSYASSSHTHSWSQITGRPSIPSPLTCMPVGYVYISWSSASPASLFGGSWVAITGRFPYFNAGTSVGGSNTHAHTLNSGYAKITSGGSAVLFNYKNVNTFNTNWAVNGSANGVSSSSVTTATTLGGNTDSNYHMPAYQELYAWRRTA